MNIWPMTIHCRIPSLWVSRTGKTIPVGKIAGQHSACWDSCGCYWKWTQGNSLVKPVLSTLVGVWFAQCAFVSLLNAGLIFMYLYQKLCPLEWDHHCLPLCTCFLWSHSVIDCFPWNEGNTQSLVINCFRWTNSVLGCVPSTDSVIDCYPWSDSSVDCLPRSEEITSCHPLTTVFLGGTQSFTVFPGYLPVISSSIFSLDWLSSPSTVSPGVAWWSTLFPELIWS